MSIKNPYQTYQQNSVTTASPGELTLMLYNGCLKFLKLAKKSIEDNNIEEKNTNLLKAQAIIQELMVTLNLDVEISKNLMQLYDFLYNQLIDANIKSDIKIIEEVEGFVMEFRDTWKELLKANKQMTPQATGYE